MQHSNNLLLKGQSLLSKTVYADESSWAPDVPNEANQFISQLNTLMKQLSAIIFGILAAVIIVYGIIVGVKYATAKKQEDYAMAKEMLKKLILGIIIMGVIGLAAGTLLGIVYTVMIKGNG